MNLESLLHNSRFNQMRGKKDNFIAPNVLLWIRPRFLPYAWPQSIPFKESRDAVTCIEMRISVRF